MRGDPEVLRRRRAEHGVQNCIPSHWGFSQLTFFSHSYGCSVFPFAQLYSQPALKFRARWLIHGTKEVKYNPGIASVGNVCCIGIPSLSWILHRIWLSCWWRDPFEIKNSWFRDRIQFAVQVIHDILLFIIDVFVISTWTPSYSS